MRKQNNSMMYGFLIVVLVVVVFAGMYFGGYITETFNNKDDERPERNVPSRNVPSRNVPSRNVPSRNVSVQDKPHASGLQNIYDEVNNTPAKNAYGISNAYDAMFN
jgi:hypothetical protein